MRRNTPEEKAALERVMMAARKAALKEGITAIAVQVVMPSGQVTQACTGEEPIAFAELLTSGPQCLAEFYERIAGGVVKPMGAEKPAGRA